MLIAKDSPLRMLPASLDRRQMLFFDGIRMAVEMTECAYERLTAVLHDFSVRMQQGDEGFDPRVSSSFVDAWSIVDSLNRLRVLVSHLPRFKQNVPAFQLFYRRCAVVERLRNVVQHLNTEINELVASGTSVWGTLRWLYVVDAAQGRFKAGALVSGTQFGEMHELLRCERFEMRAVVDNVLLTASGHELALSTCVRIVADVVRHVEDVIAPQWAGQQLAPSDTLIVSEFTLLSAEEAAAAMAAGLFQRVS